MDELWGEFRPVPEGSIVTYRGGETVRVKGLEIRVHDTPGHARHHLVFEMNGLLFSGDAACVRIPGTDFIDPPAVPPEFDLEAWLRTLDLLRGLEATALYPTHFGRFTDVTAHIDRAEASLREVTAFVGKRLEEGEDEATLLGSYRAWQRERARAAGLDESHLRICAVANPPEISVGGLVRYWARKRGG